MKSKHLILLLFVFTLMNSFAQSKSKEKYSKDSKEISFFTINNSSKQVDLFKEKGIEGKVLKLDKGILASFYRNPQDKFTLIIPDGKGIPAKIELQRRSIFSKDFKYRTSSGIVKSNDDRLGLHYIGKVKGGASALFTIFDNIILGNFETKNDTFFIGITSGSEKNEQVVYNSKGYTSNPIICGTEETSRNVQNSINKQIERNSSIVDTQDRPLHLDIEIDGQFAGANIIGWDPVQAASHVLNEAFYIFDNEEVSMFISSFFVWEGPQSSFVQFSGANYPTYQQWLGSYLAYKDHINGDMSILFVEGISNAAGVATGYGGLFTCSDPNTNIAVCYLANDLNIYPEINNSARLVAHEVGHLLSSAHTHSPLWNGNNTRLDDCSGDNTIPVVNGLPDGDQRTTMSYCSSATEAASELRRGFGTQPGNMIRNFIKNNAGVTWAEANSLSVGCRDLLNIHRIIKSDNYENHNAVFKANEIHAYNTIEAGASAVYKSPVILLEDGFEALGTFETILEPCSIPIITETCAEPIISVSIKIWAQAFWKFPFDANGNIIGPAVISTELRDLGLIPVISPYTDGASVANTSIFSANGILDWIWVELRDGSDPTIVLEGKSGLLKDDGSIIDPISLTPLNFGNFENFYVAVNHRNHLGVMTQSEVVSSGSSFYPIERNYSIDFTTEFNNVATYGTNAMKRISYPGDTIRLMWAGDVNNDSKIIHSGQDSDLSTMLSEVLNNPANLLNLSSYPLDGYYNTDVTVDGITQYVGVNPDTVIILENILNHPENILGFITFIIHEQIPN